jgi:DNA-binding transcriptional LysR family regulator
MDTYSRMRAFVSVIDAGGYSAAARRTGRSKALLSKHVSELEETLGVRLVNRTTRQLSLTEAGTVYHQEASEILQRIADLEASVQELHLGVKGLLKVAGPRTIGDELVACYVIEFAAAEPDVTIDLQLEDRFVDLVEEGYDVAIRIAELADSSLIARRLAAFRVPVVATPERIAADGPLDRPEALAGRPCLVDTQARTQGNWSFVAGGERRTVTVAGPIRMTSPSAARSAALAGLGYAKIPFVLVRDDIAAGRLKVVLEAFEPNAAAVYAVYPHRRHLSRKVRAFVDHLVKRFAAADADGVFG